MSEENFGTNSRVQELQEDIDSLRQFVFLLLCSALLLTGGLCAYMFRLTAMQSRQMGLQREVIRQMTEEREKLGAVVAQFEAFGLRSPDFAPILAKYGLKPKPLGASPATNAPAAK